MNEQKCVPCSANVEALTREKCLDYLKDLTGWLLDDEARSISRKFSFKNFVQALEFANKTGRLAEEMGHHPVITMGWGFCTVKFKTSKINGLHSNDFVMAALVNKL